MYMIHPDHLTINDRERSLRAAERFELEQALRAADELRRADRRAARLRRAQHYLRLVLDRVA